MIHTKIITNPEATALTVDMAIQTKLVE